MNKNLSIQLFGIFGRRLRFLDVTTIEFRTKLLGQLIISKTFFNCQYEVGNLYCCASTYYHVHSNTIDCFCEKIRCNFQIKTGMNKTFKTDGVFG